MADKTGTYILENLDGFRVIWGSEIENKFHSKMTPSFRNLLYNVPFFVKYSEAIMYARVVESANDTARKIIIISTYRKLHLKDMHV